MKVKIQLYASLREALGDFIEIELEEPASVKSLMTRFVELHPQYEGVVNILNVAVDLEYSQHDVEIRPGQEVAIFPPVSGG